MLDVDLLVQTGGSIVLSTLMDELARMQPAARPADAPVWLREHLAAGNYFTTFESFRVLLSHAMVSIAAAQPQRTAGTDAATLSPQGATASGDDAAHSASPAPSIPPILLLVLDCLCDLSVHFQHTTHCIMWDDMICTEFATGVADLFSALCGCARQGAERDATLSQHRRPAADLKALLALQLLRDTLVSRKTLTSSASARPVVVGSFYRAVTQLATSIAQGRYLRAKFDATILPENGASASSFTASIFPVSSVEIVLPVVPSSDGVATRNAAIDDYVRSVIAIGDAMLHAAHLSDPCRCG